MSLLVGIQNAMAKDFQYLFFIEGFIADFGSILEGHRWKDRDF